MKSTRKKTTKETNGATIPQVSAADVDRARGRKFTTEQAERYGGALGMIFSGDDNDIADAILAFRACCYHEDKEDILSALERGLMPLCPSIGNAMDALVAQCSREWDEAEPPKK